MPIYERCTGGHVAERVRPAEGSDDAEQYARLAEDPASGWRCAEQDEKAEAPATEPVELERPAKSASKADWKAYAISQGLDEDEAEKATRDELAARYAVGGDS
ncbi:hypothetical protein ACFYWS_39330 [Streptomyces sp. NPDC002795]|uniref:hypothetical protein n=1 Tax=Streptomyces sp. NPDC002795 TaxID=3364665 RepID=UPI0036B6BCB8